MKYFVDFEATQFCQRIISIGCVSEKGDKFYTLVKTCGDDKVSSYITKLTGITNQKLKEEGFSADEAFENFFQWVCNTNDGTLLQYYCYGNCDVEFVKNTIKKMKSAMAITFATALETSLIDYSRHVKTFFGTQNPFALRKMYTFLKEEELEIQHDALEDAEMLAFVVTKFNNFSPEDKDAISVIKNEKPVPNGSSQKAPEKFINWPGDKMKADTGADFTNWEIKAVISGGPHKKYFDSMETAVMWIVKYMAQGVSIKNFDQCEKVKNKIENSIKTGKSAYNCKFYKKEED